MHHQTAQGIAALGRGEDKMLVHMTPGEVEGLQKLALAHGGSLTINPQTGLPEAGFLSSILPMAAAMAANMVVPGSGVIVGAGLGAMMNEKSPLMGAITGGLGGYGIGQVGSSLASMGSEQAATALASEAAAAGGVEANIALQQEIARQAAERAATTWTPNIPIPGVEGATTSTYTPAYFANTPEQYAQSVRDATVNAFGPAQASAATRAMIETPMTTGAKQLGEKGGLKALVDKVGYLPLAGLAAPLVSGLMGQSTPLNAPKAQNQYYKTSYNPGTYNPQFGQPGQAYFSGQGYGPGAYSTGYAAGGGVSSLGEYAAGGKLLRGDGDGMSDSIPAVIKGPKPQRAALADGEFVIPADMVSHLGNGSTEAGAKRLYAMMDRVRKARTGTTKQGRQINPEQYMPA
jgi:hypothetical protein